MIAGIYLDAATRQIVSAKAAIATASTVPAQAAWMISSRLCGWQVIQQVYWCSASQARWLAAEPVVSAVPSSR